jgi:hypothetical protein
LFFTEKEADMRTMALCPLRVSSNVWKERSIHIGEGCKEMMMKENNMKHMRCSSVLLFTRCVQEAYGSFGPHVGVK